MIDVRKAKDSGMRTMLTSISSRCNNSHAHTLSLSLSLSLDACACTRCKELMLPLITVNCICCNFRHVCFLSNWWLSREKCLISVRYAACQTVVTFETKMLNFRTACQSLFLCWYFARYRYFTFMKRGSGEKENKKPSPTGSDWKWKQLPSDLYLN